MAVAVEEQQVVVTAVVFVTVPVRAFRAFHCVATGFEEGLKTRRTPKGAGMVLPHPILSDVETQEVKPDLPFMCVKRVDNPGLTRFQTQAHPC